MSRGAPFALAFLLWFECSERRRNAQHLVSIMTRAAIRVASEVWFDATVEQVFEVFRRWDLSTQFSSVIAESRDIAPDEYGRPGYYVRNEGCLLFFCKSFVRQGLRRTGGQRGTARRSRTLKISDFKLSNETWTFAAENGGTAVSYRLLMEPDFWVPPVIGPYIIKRKFRNNGGDAIDRIEEIAQDMLVPGGIIID